MSDEGSSPSEGSEETAPEQNVADAASTDHPEPSTPDANETPEASSTSDGTDAKEPTLLEAVEQALEKPAEDGAAPSSAESEQDTKTATTEADEAKGGDGEEGDPPPFHEHPRWKQLVAERDELKVQAEEAGEASETITRLTSYLDSQNLSVAEFNNLLALGGLVKNDPAKALEALTPIFQAVQQAAGAVLPADLQTAVEQGFVTEAYAQQLSQAQAQVNQSQFQAQVAQTSADTERQTTKVNALGSEATAWETAWQKSDPDYSKKADLVKEKVETAVLRGEAMDTPEQVRAICEKAKTEVETLLRNLMPKKTAITSNTPQSTTGGGTASEPKSLIEAMQAALEA